MSFSLSTEVTKNGFQSICDFSIQYIILFSFHYTFYSVINQRPHKKIANYQDRPGYYMTYHLHSTNIHTALLSIKNTDVPITKYQASRYSARFVPQRLTPLYHMNTILSNSACFLGSWHLNPGTPQSILTNSHYPLGRACTMIKI